MSKFLKKYSLPIVLVALLAGYFLLTRGSDQSLSSPKPQTASEKIEKTAKVKGTENKEQSSNPQETKTQSKVQGSSTTHKQTSQTNQTSGSTNEAGIPIKEVSLKIEAGSKGTYIYQIPWESGDNVWKILQRAGELKHFPIEHDDQTYKPRIYVTDIYDTNCECWTFKVDGKCSNQAANLYTVEENSSILWSINKMCS